MAELSANTKRCQQAHLQLSFNPEMHVYIDSSEFWLEPASEFPKSKAVIEKPHISQMQVMREKRRGERRILNHWNFLIG